jgi:type III secretion protein C
MSRTSPIRILPAVFLRRVLAAVLLGLAAAAALAGPMPNGLRKVQITAREQPVAAFLLDLFASVGVPAAIAPGVTGQVNGSFVGPADKVLADLTRVYNLVSYYDGSVMHVSPAAEVVRRTFTMAPQASDRLLREVAELNLPDPGNTLRRSSDGNLIAVGTPRFVEQVDELVRVVTATAPGAPASRGEVAEFRVFYLRYAWAQDTTINVGGRQVVLPGVASILRSLVGVAPSAPLGSETRLRPTQPGLRGQGLAAQGQAPAKSGDTSRRGHADKAADALVAALARTAETAAGEAEVARADAAPAVVSPDGTQIRIEAEPRLNAVIVRDRADRLPRYEQLIAQLDVEPQSLEIEATIIDVNTDRLRELGINWRWNNAGFGLQSGDGATGALPLAGGVASVVLGSAGQFVARINALQAEGAARVVSSPQVVTLSNVEAVFDNSSTFFVRVAGRDEVDLFNVSAGTSLRVTPHVFRDRNATRIKLMVNVEDGNLTGRSVDQIPVVERSTINTQALIAEGESLLIGGMSREATLSSVDKVPVLGDVPVVGNLFKNRVQSGSRIERMFLITPRLAASRRPAAEGPVLQAAAPRAAPPAVAVLAPSPTPAAQPAPAVAPAPTAVALQVAARPVTVVPPVRESVVLDLDAMPVRER